MIPNRYSGIGWLFLGFQLLVSLIIFWAIFLSLYYLFYKGAMASPLHYTIGSGLWLTALLLEYLTRGTREKRYAGLNRQSLRGLSNRQMVFAMATIFAFIVISKDHSVSRTFLTCLFGFQFLWLNWSNTYGYRFLHRKLYNKTKDGLSPTLILGNSKDIKKFLSNPLTPSFPGLQYCGYVTSDPINKELMPDSNVRALGRLQDVREICGNTNVKALLLLGLQDRTELVSPVVQLADDFGLRAMWVDNVEQKFGKKFHPFHTDSYSIVSHLNEPLENPVNRFYKRCLDLVGSLFGLLFVLPLAMALVWVIHRVKSPGPLFYRQDRTGRNGETFKVFKFRSMYVERNDEGCQTRKNDSRIFPGGNFIRKSSIDELPQLINVFLGDMSIVGPRPHAEFTDKEHAGLTPLYRLRSLAKPGITGLAQCKGYRGETVEPSQIRNRIRLDLFYIQKWSIALDLMIIFLTVVQMIKPPKTAF